MEKNEYIEFEFEFKSEDRFNDFLKVFKLISNSKKSEDYKSDEFWFGQFPNYALQNYYFSDSDLKPEFSTADSNDGTWHFYSMIEHLVENLDVELLECKKMENTKGRLDFYAHGYPYGGITGLTMFLRSFDLKATKIDEGGGVYNVQWTSETEFKLTEIKDTLNKYSLLSKIKRFFNS